MILAFGLPIFFLCALAWHIVTAWRERLERPHRREVLEPIEAAAMNILRTRSGIAATIPPELVGAEAPGPVGLLTLPMDWSGADGDRDNLTAMIRDRLGATISLSFDMAGSTPSARITVPKQPPPLVSWLEGIDKADTENPYLGESAAGAVNWELGDDSPHIGVPGRSGSGKSELMAWIVAQFMRGGAGIVVLDPKATSHRWLLDLSLNGDPAVLYCSERAMLFDTVMWLDSVMDERIGQNRSVSDDIDFPRIVVLLEERNSLQDKLRDAWTDRRVPGQPQMSPAIRALDRLSSMGRSLHINIVLGAQATAQVDIGKKGNYGAWAVSGGMTDNHWKNVGAKKPAISSRPGRWGYVVGGSVQAFQAVYPDLKNNRAGVVAWATGGAARFPVTLAASEADGAATSSSWVDTVPFPSWEQATTTSGGSGEVWKQDRTTLPDWADKIGVKVETVRAWSRRYKDSFPQVVGTLGASRAYEGDKLDAWFADFRPAPQDTADVS